MRSKNKQRRSNMLSFTAGRMQSTAWRRAQIADIRFASGSHQLRRRKCMSRVPRSPVDTRHMYVRTLTIGRVHHGDACVRRKWTGRHRKREQNESCLF